MIRARSLLSVVAALYLVALIGLAFIPRGATVLPSEAAACIQFALASVLLVMLLGRRRWWVALGFAVLGAGWIEAAQSVWMPTGYAGITDVIAGTVGAVIGVLVTIAAHRALRHEPARSAATENALSAATETAHSNPRV
ncbi:MAG: VanZ family protein [Salinibacterium sp.]|nr:VanZ family protein [Salinibacterium sp.]